MTTSYFDDLKEGAIEEYGEYIAEEEEMLAFAKKWDPQGIHIDKEIAVPLFGSLIAPMSYTMAIAARFISLRPNKLGLIAGLGSDGFELPMPLRPGDHIRNKIEWTKLVPSKTKKDRGVAHMTQTLSNQVGDIIFITKGRMMIARK